MMLRTETRETRGCDKGEVRIGPLSVWSEEESIVSWGTEVVLLDSL